MFWMISSQAGISHPLMGAFTLKDRNISRCALVFSVDVKKRMKNIGRRA
jgi:hypothetical protein